MSTVDRTARGTLRPEMELAADILRLLVRHPDRHQAITALAKASNAFLLGRVRCHSDRSSCFNPDCPKHGEERQHE